MVIALISRGTVEANRPKVTEYGLTHVLLQKDREVVESYQDSATPGAVLVRQDGTIGSPLAQGADAIRALLDKTLSPAVVGTLPMAPEPLGNGQRAMAAPRPPTGPTMGEAAPDFRLPDLAGKFVHLSDFQGSPTLVLFWRPSCGFCQRMLKEIQAWEAKPPKGTSRAIGRHTCAVGASSAGSAPTSPAEGTSDRRDTAACDGCRARRDFWHLPRCRT